MAASQCRRKRETVKNHGRLPVFFRGSGGGGDENSPRTENTARPAERSGDADKETPLLLKLRSFRLALL